jgi:hypothetical protein
MAVNSRGGDLDELLLEWSDPLGLYKLPTHTVDNFKKDLLDWCKPLDEMINAKHGTVFVLKGSIEKNTGADDTVEIVSAHILRYKDEPTPSPLTDYKFVINGKTPPQPLKAESRGK